MSRTHDIRASMSVQRIITDDQAMYFAQHQANGQAPERQQSTPHATPGREDSRQASSLQAAQALLSLSQSPRIGDEVPEVSAAMDVRAPGRPSPIDQRLVASPSTDDVRAQGRSLLFDLPPTTFPSPIDQGPVASPSTDHVRSQGLSPLVDLPPANFPSTRHAPMQARSSSIDLPTTSFTSMNHRPAQARSLSTNLRTTGFTSTNHGSMQARLQSTGLPRMNQPSTDDAHVSGSSNGLLVTRPSRMPVGRGNGRARPTGVSKRKPAVKKPKPNPMDYITAGTPQTREFECTYGNPCMLGQYTVNLSRKMVSDYFGRNKKATAMIEGKWIMSCRKHYQRLSYQESWPFTKADIVQSQLVEINQIEPNMTWEIKLKNSEEKRLTDYLHDCSQNGSAPVWSSPTATFIPDGTNGKKQSSLAVLHSLHGFCGKAKTTQDCRDIIAAATAALHSGKAVQFPLFEMIPQFTSLAKRKRSASSASGNEGPSQGRPRKRSRSSDEEDDFVEADGHEDDSEDEDFVMDDVESESEA
ncbi:hypothetical protein IWX90DRAFT_128551 [Phyllosticta citrichinensis]|uniref:Uncharacterized protein n=1 Tax=Phyllosticta citrichinensis TaxID=1130410 RepID=A0ABR1Y4Y4_9PEZI